MPLLSLEFALCFLIFLPIYWQFKHKPHIQNTLLLLASLLYLSSFHWAMALAVVWFSLAISAIAIQIDQNMKPHSRQKWLWFGLGLSVCNLAFFKYFDFFRGHAQNAFGWELADWIMPLGISYYTFQAISYLINVYRYDDEMVRLSRGQLLLHLSFFPTITSGPIIRAGSLKSINGKELGFAPQIQTQQPRQMIRPIFAISLMLLGVFKKWVLSGHLAESWVNPIFENPLQYDVFTTFSAIYGYTLQLFLDFSGYSDLVIGMAMLLGFRLPENFKMPLLATDIRNFWERWHITLSTWIRDYIYIPLGGSRKSFVRTQMNVMIAMLLSGIWHGYGWNFLLWGWLHGMAFLFVNTSEHYLGKHFWQQKLGKFSVILLTFTFICVSFVIFRTSTLQEAQLIFTALGGGGLGWKMPNLWDCILLVVTVGGLIFYSRINQFFNQGVQYLEQLDSSKAWILAIIWGFLMMMFVVFAPAGIPGFIYANF